MIDECIANKDYTGLLKSCEQYKLTYDTLASPSTPLVDVYSAYLGCYIIADDLHSAQFLRKRLLTAAKAHDWTISTETENMWQVCAALWKTDYEVAYNILNESAQWSTRLQPMIPDILESIRERVAALLAKAYTTITMNDVINYFGMQENDIIQALSTKGWSYDSTTQIFTTWKQEPTQREPSNFGQLSTISDIVLHLEKF
ncbi:unnamed protein product [Absidia cylindrospora]